MEIWFKPWQSRTLGGIVLALEALVATSIFSDWPIQTSKMGWMEQATFAGASLLPLIVGFKLIMGDYDERGGK